MKTICKNGHLINGLMESNPEHNASFCMLCGLPALSQCEYCQTNIRGDYHGSWVNDEESYDCIEPAYCTGCGQPFPWTVARIAAIEKGLELSSEVSNKEKDEILTYTR